jgi:hypothetical protein
VPCVCGGGLGCASETGILRKLKKWSNNQFFKSNFGEGIVLVFKYLGKDIEHRKWLFG